MRLPRFVEQTLRLDAQIQTIARSYFKAQDFLFLGRGIMFPIAILGAVVLLWIFGKVKQSSAGK